MAFTSTTPTILSTAMFSVNFLLLFSLVTTSMGNQNLATFAAVVKGRQLSSRPCNDIYVVGDGETLHSISDKCGDPFIIERNPHIHDPDDVYPGLVIKIAPFSSN